MTERPEGPILGTFDEWTAKHNIDPGLILGWVVWFADGGKFSSKTSEADDLPTDGCQGVRVFHLRTGPGEEGTVYSLLISGHDPYWLPGATHKIRGAWVTDAEHDRFSALMSAETWEP